MVTVWCVQVKFRVLGVRIIHMYEVVLVFVPSR